MLSSVTVFQYLAAVNKSSSNLITEQILEASPLLESFGNAKTVRWVSERQLDLTGRTKNFDNRFLLNFCICGVC